MKFRTTKQRMARKKAKAQFNRAQLDEELAALDRNFMGNSMAMRRPGYHQIVAAVKQKNPVFKVSHVGRFGKHRKENRRMPVLWISSFGPASYDQVKEIGNPKPVPLKDKGYVALANRKII